MIAIPLFPPMPFAFIDLPRFDLQSFARFSSTQILNCAVEGLGIAVLAWILLRALGRQNSGTRFAVWFSALVGIAALPLLGTFGSRGTEMAGRSEITMPASWALYIFAGWTLIAAAGLVRIGVGFCRLRQLRKSCVPIDAATLDPLLRKTLEEFDSPRSVAVCVSDLLRVPTAIGFTKPLVVIPSWTMQELSAAELNAILLHELAHLRRWDDWTNLVQKVLSALLFFHPAVWWIEKKLALEREMACDDLVLTKTESPRVYAECLVSLAEKSLLRRGLTLAQAAVGRVRHMSLRVTQILDERRPGATGVWRPAPALLMGISLAALMVLSDAPRLVSFEGSPAGSPATASIVPNSGAVDPISDMSSHVVPAEFVVRPSEQNSVSVATETKRTRKTNTSQSSVLRAKVRQRRVNPPVLVRTSFAEDAVRSQTLVFIVQAEIVQAEIVQTGIVQTGIVQTGIVQTEISQTGRRDSSGLVIWDLCVWQVTVMGPAQNRTEPGVVVKSI